MARADLVGWASTQRIAADGAVESEQRVAVDRPVVERSEEGARRLASRYWVELRRSRIRRGLFYALVQRRLHLAVSRGYFRRLIGGDPP
jgi:hypothetical protein